MNDRIKNLEPFWGEWYLTSDKPLGRGGFGAVYEIERRELGIVFKAALKVISIPKDPDEYRAAIAEGRSEDSTSKYFRNMVESMSKEFALMDMVKGHTNIVDYADHKIIERSDEFGWDILIRMELLTPLEKYMIANPLDENEEISLGIDICSAL